MKKTILLVSLFSVFFSFSQKQFSWKRINKSISDVENNFLEVSFEKEGASFFELDYASFKQKLFSAPKREALRKSNVLINFPNSAGEFEEFEMYEASNFE